MSYMEKYNKELEEIKAALGTLTDKVNKLQQKAETFCNERVPGVNWPQLYDEYWFITDEGNVSYDIMYNVLQDKRRMIVGNMYRSEKEALVELNRRKITQLLQQFCLTHEEVMERRFENDMYYMYVSAKDTIKISRTIGYIHSTIYFDSVEAAQMAIEHIGEENIKKYYFGIEGGKQDGENTRT